MFLRLTKAVVMWNDIDLYHAVRDFTSDPVTYPGEAVRAFTTELVISSVASPNYSIHSTFRLRPIRNARCALLSGNDFLSFFFVQTFLLSMLQYLNGSTTPMWYVSLSAKT